MVGVIFREFFSWCVMFPGLEYFECVRLMLLIEFFLIGLGRGNRHALRKSGVKSN